MKHTAVAFLLILGVLAVSGCDNNPTNEPPQQAIDKAKADRAAAIDNDPKLTPEGKAKMKEMLKLDGSSNPEQRG